MKTTKQILEKISKEYKQESFDYALKNCLNTYLHIIVEEAMKEYGAQLYEKGYRDGENDIATSNGIGSNRKI